MVDDAVINILKEVAISMALLIVVYLIGRQFLSIWKTQVENANEFQEKLLKQYSSLDSSLEEVKESMIDLTNRIADGFKEIDTALRQLRNANAEGIKALQEYQTSQQAELTALRDEVKNQMGDLKKDNQDIQEQLRELTTQLKHLTDTLEAAEISRAIQFFQEYSEIPKQANSLLQEIKSAVERLNEDQGKEQS